MRSVTALPPSQLSPRITHSMSSSPQPLNITSYTAYSPIITKHDTQNLLSKLLSISLSVLIIGLALQI